MANIKLLLRKDLLHDKYSNAALALVLMVAGLNIHFGCLLCSLTYFLGIVAWLYFTFSYGKKEAIEKK